ncbi:acetylcholine receptor subunit beta-like [Saccostrea cucullata]|uniref:acetylcholine receptor subunit beta-like n=1 Tax=Saccostrea cuccullata TaxID=36930 RepID=UPI002ED50CBB
MYVSVKVFIAVMALWTPVSTSKATLRRQLLQNYTKELPPNDTKTVVNLHFSAFNIIDFDDKDGKFSVSGYLEVSWEDARIAENWASSLVLQNENVSMYFKESEVWTPEIRQMNPFSRFDYEKMVEETVMFQRNGSALMIKMDVFTTECKTDFFYFPFDSQKCSIDIAVWGYFMEEIVLKARKNNVGKELYEENNVWNMTGTNISIDSIPDLGTNEVFKVSKATIEFKIKRYSSYYVYFLIVPFILMQFLQAFVFWMPWDCGERVSFSVTVLLAMAVYLTIVTEHIPKSSSSRLSFLGIKMVMDLCISAYIQLFVIVNNVIYSRSRHSEQNASKDSENSKVTSISPNIDLNREENIDWIARGMKMDNSCFTLSLIFTSFSMFFPMVIFILS